MKRGIFIIFAILFISKIAYSQEHFITNLYVYDSFLMNPAFAGGDRRSNKIDAYYQKQWAEMSNAPSTQVLSYQFGISSKMGSGTYIYNDVNGYTSQLGLQQSFSYELTLEDNSRRKSYLTFGLSLIANQAKIDESSFSSIYDPSVSGGVESGWGLNANTGILLKINHYHFGISMSNLLGQTNTLYVDDSANKLYADYHFHAGTWFKMTGRDIYFYPELMYRRNELADARFDVNLKLKMPTYNDNVSFWTIVCYRRSQDHDYGRDLSMSGTLGINFGQISCGLEYQQGLAGAQRYYGNGLQFVLGYRFNFKDPSKSSIPCSFQDVFYDGYGSKNHKSGKGGHK